MIVKRLYTSLKFILIDSVGVLLIIAAGLTGWLPGPGGIPLLIAGLSVLSINHTWAKRLLKRVKKDGAQIFSKIFNDHPVWQAAYDISSVIFITVGIYLINTYTRNLTLSFAIFLTFTGLALFLGNRRRLQNLTQWVKTLTRRN